MSYRLFLNWSILLITFVATVRAEIVPDFLMDSDPNCNPLPPVMAVMTRHKDLWIKSLSRPEIDLQRMSAESISLAAKKGVPGLAEAIPGLETILTAESTHPVARFSAARALVVLDSRGSAEKLFQASQKYGSDLKQLVEPALAEWEFGPAKSVWTGRLADPATRQRERILAIRGLGKVRETSSLSTLQGIALNPIHTPDVRLEAASAAGQISEQGLEEDAARLIQVKPGIPFVDRHCAIRLLARHTSEKTRALLAELVADPEPSITASALQRLYEIDPALVLPFAESAMRNGDANVRKQGANAFISLPQPDRIRILANLLNDPHPSLRRSLCENLKVLADMPNLNDSVRSAGLEILAGENWRGQEQASLLLGELEHRPAVARLIELLESGRKEVMISSAWALRKIADPQSTASLIDKIRRQTELRKNKNSEEIDLQVAHLFEACGQIRAKDAEAIMMEYVPKDLVMGEQSRSAAVWALGKIHQGVVNESLGVKLMERINDPSMLPPESNRLKDQAIIALGRMKAASYAPDFKRALVEETPNDRTSLSKRWAVREMTGEEFPDPIPGSIGTGEWFLEPIVSPVKE